MLAGTRWTNLFYVFHVVNFLTGLGFAVLAYTIGAEERSNLVNEFHLHSTRKIVLITGVTSLISLATPVVGYLAQKLTKRPSLWILFWVLLTLLSVMTFAVAVTSFYKIISGDKPVKAMLRQTMEVYVSEDSEIAKRWDKLHIGHKCCGTDSYTEWQDVPYGRTTLRTPTSCCLPQTNTDPDCSLNVLPVHDKAHKFVYTRGCFQPMMEGIYTQMTALGVFALIISTFNVILVSFTCYSIIMKKV